ncbi:MAG: NTP transferase domain-containing protein [Fidelibacterota bacterium]
MRVAAVILAAGGSARTAGENKLLFPQPGEGGPVIAALCRNVMAARFRPVVIVTGYQASRIRKALEQLPVETVHNGRWKEGMSSSIRAGVNKIGKRCDGVGIVPADMPRLTAGTLTLLRDRFESLGGRHIVYPTFRGTQGNPVIFPRRFFPHMMRVTGDRGCKGILRTHQKDTVAVSVPSEEILLDYDTVSEYRKLGGQIGERGDG